MHVYTISASLYLMRHFDTVEKKMLRLLLLANNINQFTKKVKK